MDNLTHSLVGALLGQAGLKRRTGLAMPALVIGANLPDVDATCTIYGIESLAMRRGLTHGPIAWVLLPLVLAAILWAFDRWQAQDRLRRGKRPEGRLPVHFGWLYALAFVACLTHPALDWLNSYGIRLLEPFSHRWFYGDALFIVDVWLWIGLGFALWRSLRLERQGRSFEGTAHVALLGLVGYVAANLAITQVHKLSDPSVWVDIAQPVPAAFWERQSIVSDGVGIWLVDGRRYGAVPLSQCDLVAARSRDPRAAAFLFWSRTPFVEHAPGGGWLLRDARFAGSAGGRFSVELPASVCRP
jgi:inner membrane protein